MKFKVKKGDDVIVITGKDKGKTGKVLNVNPSEARVLVQGINVMTRHRKASAGNPGGIEQAEAPIHISNVSHIDPKSKKPARVGYAMVGERKVRKTKKSGEVIDR